MRGITTGEAALHPRVARGIAVAVLASLVSVYVLAAISGPGEAVAVGTLSAAVFGLQLRYILPGLARFRTRRVLAVQAALTCLAVLGLGVTVSMFGLLIAALLLGSAWRTALLVGAGATVVQALRAGSPVQVLDYTITMVLTGLVVYGLARLTDRIEEVFAARLTLAVAAVEEERLRMAASLNEGVGRGLAAIVDAAGRPGDLGDVLDLARGSLATARSAAADLRSLSLAPEVAAARGLLSAAEVEATVRIGHTEPLGPAGTLLATVLREAVTDVVRRGTARHCLIETAERDSLLVLRVTSDAARTAEQGAEGLDPLTERVTAAGGHLTAGLDPDGRFTVEAAVKATAPPKPRPSGELRLSVILLGAVLAGFSAKALLMMAPVQLLTAVPCLAVIGALQLRWARSRGRYWAWGLALQAVLSYVPLLWLGKSWAGAPGFLAGSVLVLLPAAAAWPLVLGLAASMGAFAWSSGAGTSMIVNAVVSAVVSALVIYGLARLARLADELRAAGAGIARAAVVQERLRAARDLHDLLGHSLAAILLKGELARRLQAVDAGRARAEIADIVEIAERARADMDTVAGAAPRLELDRELESARSVLAAAGIQVRLERDGAPPAEAEAVLSTVLREAVTNVLRHSSARYCEITAGTDRLVVTNDGVPAEVTPPGSGIGNLTTRLAALGGDLDARPLGDGRFQVTAALDPAGFAGDADGVGAAAGVQLGDDRGQVVADGPGR